MNRKKTASYDLNVKAFNYYMNKLFSHRRNNLADENNHIKH
jgi:hypothetical protein